MPQDVTEVPSAERIPGAGPTSDATRPGYVDTGQGAVSGSLDAHALRVQNFIREWEEVARSQPASSPHDFYYFQLSARDAEFARMSSAQRQAILIGERLRAERARAANPQNVLLRLPAELRNHIFDLVSREQISEWIRVIKQRPNKFYWAPLILAPRHINFNLIHTCEQMARECGHLVDSLLKAEAYGGKPRSWCAVSRAQLETCPKVGTWVGQENFVDTLSEAKALLERTLEYEDSSGWGVVHFLPGLGSRIFTSGYRGFDQDLPFSDLEHWG